MFVKHNIDYFINLFKKIFHTFTYNVLIQCNCSVYPNYNYSSVTITNLQYYLFFPGYYFEYSSQDILTNDSIFQRKHSCPNCFRCYKLSNDLMRHLKFDCGKSPRFGCSACSHRSRRQRDLQMHILSKHGPNLAHCIHFKE